MTRQAKFTVGAVVLVAAALLGSTQVLSQEKADAQPSGEDGMAEMMAKYAELNAVGPEHKELAKMVGTWDAENKMWMHPGAEPSISKGVAEFRAILGGRFVEQSYKCDMMGQPFVGLGINGYDTLKKQYVSIWMDTMSNAIYMSTGTADESGKVTTYYGTMDDAMTGEKDKPVKSVAREINEDKVIFEMYDKPAGKPEFLTMEITYTRRK